MLRLIPRMAYAVGCGATLCVWAQAQSLEASPTDYQMTGSIISASSPTALPTLGIALGDPFSVTFNVDPTLAVDRNPLPNTGLYFFDEAPLTVRAAQQLFISSGLFAVVQNDSACCPSTDFITIQGTAPFTSTVPASFMVVGLTVGLTTTDLTTLSSGDFTIPTEFSRFAENRTLVISLQNTQDMSLLTLTGLISLDTPSPAGQITSLMTTISGIGAGPGLTNSLNAHLGSGLLALARNNNEAACGMLNAFIYQVRAQYGRRLTAEQSNQLIVEATTIVAAVGCP